MLYSLYMLPHSVHLSLHESVCLPVHFIHQSIHPHTFFHDGLMDFLHIWYHDHIDQVPWAADVCKIEFGSVQNLNNYGYFFILFVCNCLLWYLSKNGLVIFIFCKVIRYHVLLIHVKLHLSPCQIWLVMTIFFINFMYLLWYIRKEWVDVVHILYSNQVPCVVDACEIQITLVSVSKLINYGIFFITFMCLMWYLKKECVDFVHIWYGNPPQLGLYACEIYLGSMLKCMYI